MQIVSGNKNVVIKLNVHNVYLESSSSSTLKYERLESQIIEISFGAIKPKKPKHLPTSLLYRIP